MPNNVFNRLELKGKPALVREILEAIQDDELGPGSIDLNKIIPMPPALLIDEGSVTHTGYEAVRDFLGRHPGIQKDELLSLTAEAARTLDPKLTVQHEQTWELGKKAYLKQLEYGHTSWYGWRIQHWGTKWNAYDQTVKENTGSSAVLEFYTAWNAPAPVVEKLAEQNPGIVFRHRWADEDIGYNCGEAEYAHGTLESIYLPNPVRDSLDFLSDFVTVTEEDYARFDEQDNPKMTM